MKWTEQSLASSIDNHFPPLSATQPESTPAPSGKSRCREPPSRGPPGRRGRVGESARYYMAEALR